MDRIPGIIPVFDIHDSIFTMMGYVQPCFEPWTGQFSHNTCHVCPTRKFCTLPSALEGNLNLDEPGLRWPGSAQCRKPDLYLQINFIIKPSVPLGKATNMYNFRRIPIILDPPTTIYRGWGGGVQSYQNLTKIAHVIYLP